MAFVGTQTAWGYYCTITSATAAGNVLVAKGTRVMISGISVCGAATTDIVTVSDGDGNILFKAASAGTNGSTSLTLAGPITVDGITVGIAGATTGFCSIYVAEGFRTTGM